MKQNSPDESFQIYADIMHKEAFLNTYVPGEPIFKLKKNFLPKRSWPLP